MRRVASRVYRMSSRWNETARLSWSNAGVQSFHANTGNAAGLNLRNGYCPAAFSPAKGPMRRGRSLMRHAGHDPTDDGNWSESLLRVAFWGVHNRIGRNQARPRFRAKLVALVLKRAAVHAFAALLFPRALR